MTPDPRPPGTALALEAAAGTALGAALAACVLAAAGVLLYASGRARRRALLHRLDRDGGPAPALPPGTGGRQRFAGVDRRVRATGAGRRLQAKLAATGLDLTPGEYVVYLTALVAVLWLLASSVLAPFFGPIAGLVGVLAANAFLAHQRQRRTEQFIGQLPELARILANATSAGLALRTALGMAAEELEAPAGDELRLVTDQLAVGRSVDDALNELAERLPSRELVVLVTTLVLANRAGGTIVASLRNLTTTLEERKETRREVRTMLAEVNATAFTIPLLGLGAMLMMNSMMPGALARVTGSPVGQVAMVVAVGLFAAGFLVIRRLGRIEV
ncbi:type II secretion system F family protein [Streptomyces sp. WMMB303]|uniref:type II secretion system F family protein n=1 Tax=Streptomyces sp. WMMB303 TaxID=3034154 RepID=UPI0023EAB22B|nr:type II secretion system F family protein [Streptomyces sp. WMMB303]MDF4253716.1 type II secretion system F family protein [Streptomyces sp. WMMB303]